MTDDEALLAAIIAAPDDDTPRLVFADWLDEHRQPERAEFIRLQIERAQLDPHSARLRECLAREAELLKRNRRAWERPFRDAVPGGAFGYTRGFVARVYTEPRFYHQSFARLLRMTPLEEVQLPAAPDAARLPRPGASHPPHVRFRLAWRDRRTTEVFTFDVLRPEPAELEPYLRRGSWVVKAVESSDYLAPTLLPAAPVREAFLRQRKYSFAVRPVVHVAEATAFWREVSLDQLLGRGGPEWFVFEDGVMVEHYASQSSEPGDSILARLAAAEVTGIRETP